MFQSCAALLRQHAVAAFRRDCAGHAQQLSALHR